MSTALSTPLVRDALRPYVGLPVHVTATLERVGAKPVGHEIQHTLLIRDITCDGVEIEHAWLKFGPTGSARIAKLRDKIWPGQTPLRCEAKVAMYVTDGVPRLGLSGPHNAEIMIGNKWRCLVRGIERYPTDDYDDELYEEDLYDSEREAQATVLAALRDCPGRDKAAEQMLAAYWCRGELVSDRQLAHAMRLLGW